MTESDAVPDIDEAAARACAAFFEKAASVIPVDGTKASWPTDFTSEERNQFRICMRAALDAGNA